VFLLQVLQAQSHPQVQAVVFQFPVVHHLPVFQVVVHQVLFLLLHLLQVVVIQFRPVVVFPVVVFPAVCQFPRLYLLPVVVVNLLQVPVVAVVYQVHLPVQVCQVPVVGPHRQYHPPPYLYQFLLLQVVVWLLYQAHRPVYP